MKLPVVELPDIQATRPAIPINLTRVGVTDVKKLIEIAREGKRPIVLIARFNIFVDLPPDRKGANLSRNFETIDEVLEEADSRPSEVTSQSATVDINRLTDQVYSSIERKLMIEKERRGLYG